MILRAGILLLCLGACGCCDVHRYAIVPKTHYISSLTIDFAKCRPRKDGDLLCQDVVAHSERISVKH